MFLAYDQHHLFYGVAMLLQLMGLLMQRIWKSTLAGHLE